MSNHALYSSKWRDRVRDGAVSSAKVIVPLVVEKFDPRTVIDVGCGEGWFVNEFREAGVTATGVDGAWAKPEHPVDLSSPPYPDLGSFDVAVSLEVAEHIAPKYAPALVEWLCSLAPVTVFSAACPKQGGTGHVNEQWPSYWADLFAAHGRRGSGVLRWELWDDDRVEVWYRQNLLVFGSDLPPDGCPSVVHPGLWDMYR